MGDRLSFFPLIIKVAFRQRCPRIRNTLQTHDRPAGGRGWWWMPEITALGQLKQEYSHQFKSDLGCSYRHYLKNKTKTRTSQKDGRSFTNVTPFVKQ